jgi:hypothetical protein
MTLVKEDGTGMSNANTYASVADGDSYHEAHLYASDWTGATTATKEAALAMATRLIDGSYQFNGFKYTTEQALQWPRELCHDPDRNEGVYTALTSSRRRRDFDVDQIPVQVVQACCEIARELIKADSTDAVDGQGLSQLSIAGAINMQFHKGDKQPTIPDTAQLFLMKLGRYLKQNAGTAKLTRV